MRKSRDFGLQNSQFCRKSTYLLGLYISSRWSQSIGRQGFAAKNTLWGGATGFDASRQNRRDAIFGARGEADKCPGRWKPGGPGRGGRKAPRLPAVHRQLTTDNRQLPFAPAPGRRCGWYIRGRKEQGVAAPSPERTGQVAGTPVQALYYKQWIHCPRKCPGGHGSGGIPRLGPPLRNGGGLITSNWQFWQ